MKILPATKVLQNVIEAKETAQSFLKYAIANKQQNEVDYWTKQIEIFTNLLIKK